MFAGPLSCCRYGRSPFQVVMDRGGRLALAVLNSTIPFPCDPTSTSSGGGSERDPGAHAALQALVSLCLRADPAARPTAAELVQMSRRLLELHQQQRRVGKPAEGGLGAGDVVALFAQMRALAGAQDSLDQPLLL